MHLAAHSTKGRVNTLITLLKKAVAAGVMLLLLIASASRAEDTASRFEELAARYAFRIEGRSEANVLRRTLEEEAGEMSPFERWRSLFREGASPRERAANALALLNALVEGGDPVRWEGVSGFFLPSFVSKPLAAADAVYAAAINLPKIGEPGAEALAGMLLERLMESPRAKFLFVSTAPEEYPELVRTLEERGVLTSFGRWIEAQVEGKLPFASPVRGRVTRNRALAENMLFLNSAGQPAPNGMYAWDRKRGRIYEVMEERDPFFWILD